MTDMENTQAIALLMGLVFAGTVIGVCIDLYWHRKSATRDTPKKTVYVSPSRKWAMVEAGVWDDPALRSKYLTAYQAYDEEKNNPPKPKPHPVDIRVTVDTPAAAPKKRGRPKGSKSKPKVRKRGRPKGSKNKLKTRLI